MGTKKTSLLMPYVGKKIHDARNANRLMQTALADKLGVAPMTVSAWERGTNKIDAFDLYQLSILLKIPFDLFFPVFGDEEYNNFVFDLFTSLMQFSPEQQRVMLDSIKMIKRCPFVCVNSEEWNAKISEAYDEGHTIGLQESDINRLEMMINNA